MAENANPTSYRSAVIDRDGVDRECMSAGAVDADLVGSKDHLLLNYVHASTTTINPTAAPATQPWPVAPPPELASAAMAAMAAVSAMLARV